MITIGEALIDFLPIETGVTLKDVSGFIKKPGGAPANVAACVRKLGAPSQIITKLGEDAFGDYLVELLKSLDIDCTSVFRTFDANTALAFVSLCDDGQRDFSFYRNPSADMLLTETEIDERWFCAGDILHFCSVSLVDAPIRKAHDRAIKIAKDAGMLISFDINVRLPLWQDHDEYRRVINSYIPEADILKVSDDELRFVTGITDENESLQSLMNKAGLLLYTRGRNGAQLYTQNTRAEHNGYDVTSVDTTGAGDAFAGAVLYKLLAAGASTDTLSELTAEDLCEIAAYANAAAAHTVTKKGAINAMPTQEDVEKIYCIPNANP